GGCGGSDRAGPRDALFLVGGATLEPDEAAALTRTALLFDGHDSDAVSSARGQWRAVTAAGLTATYWAQEPDGRWTRKATSGTAG
ncbi:MAG: DNA polymerase III subunit chi, partial [Pseudomonadota bacterium]